MTTENYIRDPRFQVIGMAIHHEDSGAKWITGDSLRDGIGDMGLENMDIVAHNAAFDAAILHWHYGITPNRLYDTLSMSRPFHRTFPGGSLAALAKHYNLGSKGTAVQDFIGFRLEDFSAEQLAAYGEYAMQDATLTYDLFKELRALYAGDDGTELRAIEMTLRMFTDPRVILDESRLTLYRDSKVGLKDRIIEATKLERSQLMSNPQFAKVLESHNHQPPTKISPRTGKTTYAFSKQDEGMQALVNSDRPIIAALAKARLAVKSTIAETRADSLIGVSKRGALPVMLNYYGAHTGRFSGGDKLNLQNFPKRGGDTELRASLCAPPDHVVLACDLAQIEARVVAWLAGQQDLVDLFARNEDVYSSFAARVFDIPVEQVTKDQRFIGKTCILGLGYGMGAPKLRETFRVMAGRSESLDECLRYVTTYRELYPQIPILWKNFDIILRKLHASDSPIVESTLAYSPGSTTLETVPDILAFSPAGSSILLPNRLPITYAHLSKASFEDGGGYRYISQKNQLGKPPKDHTNIYGGKVVENVVQALAALIIRWQMVEIETRFDLRPVFQVHDELVYVVPRHLAGYYASGIRNGMRTIPPWAQGLPVDCEISVGFNYGELRELT
tara:strand:- start:2432 stop:4282 length:1851 start_codon:yes stop_codon:yes gene_type:complete